VRSAIALAYGLHGLLFFSLDSSTTLASRRCSRASTVGGTRPRCLRQAKYFFTRRELMNEYVSLAIMKTVSIAGRNRGHQRHLQLILVIRNRPYARSRTVAECADAWSTGAVE